MNVVDSTAGIASIFCGDFHKHELLGHVVRPNRCATGCHLYPQNVFWRRKTHGYAVPQWSPCIPRYDRLAAGGGPLPPVKPSHEQPAPSRAVASFAGMNGNEMVMTPTLETIDVCLNGSTSA